MNEPNVEYAPHFQPDEVGALLRSGDEVGLSRTYKPSDEQWSYICEIVHKLTDSHPERRSEPLTPSNLRLKRGEDRKYIRRMWSRLGGTDPYDQAIMRLVRQALEYERYEVVFNAIIERIGEWD